MTLPEEIWNAGNANFDQTTLLNLPQVFDLFHSSTNLPVISLSLLWFYISFLLQEPPSHLGNFYDLLFPEELYQEKPTHY